MTNFRQELIREIESFQTSYQEEKDFISRFILLLQQPDAFQRHHLPGHITASAFIIDPEQKSVLLTHHAKLNRWLQPGGHADGNENTEEVARTEALEETGLSALQLQGRSFFDLDIHAIPARGDMPVHDHYDVRYLFIAHSSTPLILSEESHALEWVSYQELAAVSNGNQSMMRMLKKAESLL